jgi:hypothetical protein
LDFWDILPRFCKLIKLVNDVWWIIQEHGSFVHKLINRGVFCFHAVFCTLVPSEKLVQERVTTWEYVVCKTCCNPFW